MVSHFYPEFAKAARRSGKIRNQCGFRGSKLSPTGEFPRNGRRRIQADDGNFVSSAPFQDPLVSRRRSAPAAFKFCAPDERRPAGLLLQILVQGALLRDIDHFHPDSDRMTALMKRVNDLLLEFVVRWLIVRFGDVDDTRALKAKAFDESQRLRQACVIARGAANER
jgi:hypothetical protein